MIAILYLHGGGHADHTRYTALIERFNSVGIISHAFDHHATTLAGRLDEAELELAKLKSQHGLSDGEIYVWGSSMGGHVAARLTRIHPDLAGVILQSAAAYSQAAENIPFGPDFTAELTRNESYLESPVFSLISKYTNPILVMYGELDNVIPQAVKDRYISRAKQNGQYFLLPKAGHSLLRPQKKAELEAWDEMANSALMFIKSDSFRSHG